MKVEQCMTRDPKTCSVSDTLDRAAQLMWDEDCGCLPVVDGVRRLLGMITDRDICMAAYTQGQPLHMLHVGGAMAKTVYSCGHKDEIESVQKTLRSHQVRRLPVIDRDGCVIGILSLSDIARLAAPLGKPVTSMAPDVVQTLAAVSQPRRKVEPLRATATSPSGREDKQILTPLGSRRNDEQQPAGRINR